jgi:CheY-like chemotaxis protein
VQPTRDGRGTRMWIGLLEPGPHIRLTVKDSGPGMERATVERCFDPFFTTKGVGKGTGLGLPAVRGIVTAHRGALTLETVPGEGTCFEIHFPRRETADEVAADEPVAPVEGQERILLVDDEPGIISVESESLQRLGYRVHGMTSSVAALQVFRASPASWDLVVTDQTMPQLTGASLARELLGLRPDLPIILCTGYSENLTQTDARSIGFREMLMKPVRGHVLAEAIRRALDGASVKRN